MKLVKLSLNSVYLKKITFTIVNSIDYSPSPMTAAMPQSM